MATRNVDVTLDPVNIVASLALNVGTRYVFQNIDTAASRIFVREAAAKPTGAALRGFVLNAGEHGVITPDATVPTWIWTDRPDGARAVIGEE